jgi:hypothetical protein
MPTLFSALVSILVASAPAPAAHPKDIFQAVAALGYLKAEQVTKGEFETAGEFEGRRLQAEAARQARIDAVVAGTYPGSADVGFLVYDADTETFRASLFVMNSELRIRIAVQRAQAPGVKADFERVAAKRPQKNSSVLAACRFWIEPNGEFHLLGDGSVRIGGKDFTVRPEVPSKVRILRTLTLPEARMPFVFLHSRRVMVSGYMGKRNEGMAAWDIDTGRLLRVIDLRESGVGEGINPRIQAFVEDPQGRWIGTLTGPYAPERLSVFELESGRLLTKAIPLEQMSRIRVSTDGAVIVTLDRRFGSRRWDPITGAQLPAGNPADPKKYDFTPTDPPVGPEYQDVSRRLGGSTAGPFGADGQSRWFGLGTPYLTAPNTPLPKVTLVEFKPVPQNQGPPGGAP